MADKTYILECKGGKQRKLVVPEEWKVTFGPLIPGERHGQGTLALRFYEGKDKQRAIFTDVQSFRDAAIPLLEKVTKTQSKRHKKNTPEGMKDFVVEARVTEWRDPDDPQDSAPHDEFLALPDDSEDGGEGPF